MGRIFPLFPKETKKKLFLGSVRVKLSEHPTGQLVDVSHTLEVVTLSCVCKYWQKGGMSRLGDKKRVNPSFCVGERM